MVKIVTILQQREKTRSHDASYYYLFSKFVSYLKLSRKFSSRFDQISGCRNMSKYFNIFPQISLRSKALFHFNVSYFAMLHERNYYHFFFFLKKSKL